MNIPIIAFAMLLASVTAQAEEVYLCKQNGKTIYTATPMAGQCQLLNLKVAEPSAEELERQKQVQQRQAAQQQMEEKQILEERKVRAEEAAARAAERQARAAETQAHYQKELLKAQEEEAIKRANTPAIIFVSPALQQ